MMSPISCDNECIQSSNVVHSMQGKIECDAGDIIIIIIIIMLSYRIYLRAQ